VRRILYLTAVGLLPALWLTAGQAAELEGTPAGPAPAAKPVPVVKPPAKCGTTPGACGDYGTSVTFVSTPSEAARQALKEEKLVMVLHVSGHFEDPGVT
jgi:hypothetical protein